VKNVKLEEKSEEVQKAQMNNEEVKKPELSKVLIATPEQIDEKIGKLRGRLPSIFLNKLAASLKKARVTEAQCDVIIERAVAAFERSKKVDEKYMMEISQRLDNLDKSILSLVQFLERGINGVEATPTLTLTPTPTSPAEAVAVPPEVKREARLTRIENEIQNIVVLLKWIEFLMERVGRENLEDVVDYYVEIGWISEEIRDKVMTYSKRIEVREEAHSSQLSIEDHVRSLVFIEKLRGSEVDSELTATLEKELEKEIAMIKKGAEE
jgi:flagellar protein FlaD